MPNPARSTQQARAKMEAAPVSPFVLITLRREAIDIETASTSWGGESSAWMAKPPEDWTGFWGRLALAAPPGGELNAQKLDGGGIGAAREVLGWGCARLSGKGAPWVGVEHVEYGNWASPRIATLALTMRFDAHVPREWSKAWDDEIATRWVREPAALIEAALAEQGFETLWSLGFEPDAIGASHPANVAAARWAPWLAAEEARQLQAQVGPGEALASPARSL